jgi:LmbE family N-acetylglucosaminyl deacetylase
MRPILFRMPSVLAVFAHPDDIEFRAAGTLLLLRDRGWEVHCCNLSNGDLGSSVMTSAAGMPPF